MNTTDTLYWEKEVKEMMDHVKKIHEKLSDGKALYNDIAGLKSVENNRLQNSKMELEDSLAQIEKMKVILETKVAEEKKAKLCRLESEEESRFVLRSLTHDGISNAFKHNLRQFMDLLNESEKINDDKKKFSREKEHEISEGNKSQSCMIPMKFIERNIQLAQCGKGVLSVTDKEKLRIQNLLMEDEEDDQLNNDSGESLKHIFSKNCKHFYGFDNESKFLLKRIDDRLEGLSRQTYLNMFESCQSSVEKESEPHKDKEDVDSNNNNNNNNNNDINLNKSKRSKNERQNLKKIEKMLSDLNSVTNEEISPLPREEMELLIRKVKQNLQNTIVNGSEEGHKDYNVKELELHGISSKDLITDLVLNAKCLMPKFKFRYDDF